MSSKESKPEEKQAQPTDKVAATFAATEKAFVDLEGKFIAARRDVREQSETYARAQEERQRATAQWDYEEGQRRQTVIDKQREDDRDRVRVYAEREADLKTRERAVHETLTDLLGPCGTPFDPKQAKQSFDKKIADAENKGKAIAEKSAASEYATKKSIDDANNAKNSALLEAENTRLKADNAKLEAECRRLSEINTDLAKRSGDLALGAFNAAGGQQGKAMESLQMAAQSGQRPIGR